MSGRIYCGDNLEVLREFIPDSSVDLVYLDPPFNSQRNYHVPYEDSQALKQAFKDCWSWEEAAPTYAKLLTDPDVPKGVKTLLRSLKELLGENDSDLLAYLSMMTPRLIAIHRTLKPTGSMYLHCDPTASHYLKAVLDAIFGLSRFRTEIIWKRSTAHSDTKQGRSMHGHIHDSILFYTKSDDWTWNPIFLPYSAEYQSSKYRYVEEGTGRRYRKGDLTAAKPGGDTEYAWKGKKPYSGRYWAYSKQKMEEFEKDNRLVYTRTGMPEYKRYLDEMPGVPLQDVWTDIDPINSQALERTGYPTQKPLALLERCIASSSNPGDVVLDPFCGCGTTVEACERLGRRWIGIDIAHTAVDVIEKRFARVRLPAPEIIWHPADEKTAHELAKRDKSKLEFERWALQKVGAAKQRKKDRGIDGESNYKDGSKSYHVLVSVKGGAVNPGMMRDLVGTVHRVQADIGVMVTLKAPSSEMKREAVEAGFLNVSDERGLIPRIQIVTVAQLFSELKPIRVLGENKTVMPKKTLPPVAGTQLSLDMQSDAGSANDNGANKFKRPSLPGGPRKTQPAPNATKAKPKSAPPAKRRSSR